MLVEIDPYAGFCFGVQKAISKVEELSSQGKQATCIGQMVHNAKEVERLTALGMKTIANSELESLSGQTVLIRTHGEPPASYTTLKNNGNEVVDATCPVVLKLQHRIKKSYAAQAPKQGQLVIYGKKDHAEVIGLNGQCDNEAIVVTTLDDLQQIDFEKPIELYCQTTMPLDGFDEISEALRQNAKGELIIHDTICRQVANRVPRIRSFASNHEVIIFVSGQNSSNGKFLFEVCKSVNANSYLVSKAEDIKADWLIGKNKIGISGATSTPLWQMEEIQRHILENH